MVWHSKVYIGAFLMLAAVTTADAIVINSQQAGIVADGKTDARPALIQAMKMAQGGVLHLVSGTYLVNNSAGPLGFEGFSGTIEGGGNGAKIVCTDLTQNCLYFKRAKDLTLTNLDISYLPTRTKRTGVSLLWISLSTTVKLESLVLHNSNSSGLLLDRDSNLTLKGITLFDNLANAVMTANLENVSASDINSHDNGDAAFEVSYYDQNAPYVCRNVTLDGLKSVHDASGILVNGCTDVALQHFNISESYAGGVAVIRDSRTTKTHFPTRVTFSHGTIEGSGYYKGGNESSGIQVNVDFARPPDYKGAPPAPVPPVSSPSIVSFNDVAINKVKRDGVRIVDRAGVFDVTLSNITVSNTGDKGYGYYFEGNKIHASKLFVTDSGKAGLFVSPKEGATISEIATCDTNRADKNTDAVAVSSSADVKMDSVVTLSSNGSQSYHAVDVKGTPRPFNVTQNKDLNSIQHDHEPGTMYGKVESQFCVSKQ